MITTQIGRTANKLNVITFDLVGDLENQLLIEEREKDKLTLVELIDQEEKNMRQHSRLNWL